mgnify:CR=1 FL=1
MLLRAINVRARGMLHRHPRRGTKCFPFTTEPDKKGRKGPGLRKLLLIAVLSLTACAAVEEDLFRKYGTFLSGGSMAPGGNRLARERVSICSYRNRFRSRERDH